MTKPDFSNRWILHICCTVERQHLRPCTWDLGTILILRCIKSISTGAQYVTLDT
jgi:hypothetical protein